VGAWGAPIPTTGLFCGMYSHVFTSMYTERKCVFFLILYQGNLVLLENYMHVQITFLVLPAKVIFHKFQPV